MDDVFLRIADQLLEDSWSVSPSALAPNAQYEAMESARHRLNSRLEQCIPDESKLDELWLFPLTMRGPHPIITSSKG